MRLSVLRFSNGRNAIPVALLTWVVASVGDAVTTAEAAFTLCYLLPIGIATWYRGLGAGHVFVALSFASSSFTDIVVGPHLLSRAAMAWNLVAELAMFLSYANILWRLKRRVDLETRLRMSALEELRHADRLNTLGKLASGVAHELGTPLAIIAGRAELIATDRVDLEGAKASAVIIGEQTERMTAIIRSMLDFSRRSGADKRPTELRALCEESASLLRSLAKRARVEIVVGGDDVQAPVNRNELQQVLSNLVSNAIQAMPEGGRVRLTVSATIAKLPEANEGRSHAYAVVAVTDEGTGIAPDVLPHVFDPFFTTKDVGQGTGLGLSVAYGIVRDHGGAIRVQSALGEGTTFSVYLPR